MAWNQTGYDDGQARPRRRLFGRGLWLTGLFVGARYGMEWFYRDSDTTTYAEVMFGFSLFALLLLVGLAVRDWMQASRDEEAGIGGGLMAKAGPLVSVGVVVALLGPNVIDGWRVVSALNDPSLADFTVEQIDRRTLRFEGAINDQSVAAVLTALEDTRIKTLWITSQGGLVWPAQKLAERIKERRIEVVAEDHCISACVMILSVSPNAAFVNGTSIVFHQPQEVIRPLDSDNAIPEGQRLREMRSYFAWAGLPDWAIDRMMESEFWSPSCQELVEMGLIQHFYDRETGARYSLSDSCA